MEEEKNMPEETIVSGNSPANVEKSAEKQTKSKSEIMEDFLRKQANKKAEVREPIAGNNESGGEPESPLSEPEAAEKEEVIDKWEISNQEQLKADLFPKANKQESKKKFSKAALITVAVLLALGLGGTAGYLYFKSKKVVQPQTAENESQAYTNEISQFMLLPDEEPTLTTVADKEKLQGQAFFANAQNGDKVLLFAKAQKTILYRPQENKIIEVMLTEVDQTALPSDNAEENSENAKTSSDKQAVQIKTVAVYNGTGRKGLAKIIGEKVSVIAGVTVKEVTNATGNYAKTVIVDLSGKNTDFVNKIITAIGGQKGDFPAAEIKPDTDILIVGGNDFKVN